MPRNLILPENLFNSLAVGTPGYTVNRNPFCHDLLYDFDAIPKGYVVLDLLGRLFRVRVIPGSILVDLTPRSPRYGSNWPFLSRGICYAMVIGFLEVLLFDRVQGKVVVDFNDIGMIAFCKNRPVPNRFSHNHPPPGSQAENRLAKVLSLNPTIIENLTVRLKSSCTLLYSVHSSIK